MTEMFLLKLPYSNVHLYSTLILDCPTSTFNQMSLIPITVFPLIERRPLYFSIPSQRAAILETTVQMEAAALLGEIRYFVFGDHLSLENFFIN